MLLYFIKKRAGFTVFLGFIAGVVFRFSATFSAGLRVFLQNSGAEKVQNKMKK